MDELIDRFLAEGPYAVVGASNDRTKFGNRVLRSYVEHDRTAFPIHPSEDEVEGLAAHRNLGELPEPVRHVSIITPPQITERIVEEAAEAGAEILWMQPGAESGAAIARAKELGMEVIAHGPCVLVELPRRARR
ncbi:MAG: CoA-binding protein [Planctomycetota bacterium]